MKIFGDNVLSLYICTQTIKGFYVYLLSSFYIGVRSFVKSTGSSSFFLSALCLFPKDSPDLRQVIIRIFYVYLMSVKNKDMKRRLLLLALTFLALTVSLRAQDRRFVYMQVEIVYYGPGYRVVADLGTPSEKVLQFNYNYLKDDADTPFCFNTKMAAVNWLAKDGWVLNDHCSRIDSTFIMKRDVSGMNETQVQAFLSRYNIGPATGSKKPTAQKKLSRK